MTNKNHNKVLGKTGENIAAKFLEKSGYKILKTNYRYSRFSEIDIIALDKDTVVFVEVKTRTTTKFGHPFEAINQQKISNIFKAGLAFLQQSSTNHKKYRIDIVSVITTEPLTIEHLKDISLN